MSLSTSIFTLAMATIITISYYAYTGLAPIFVQLAAL